jgi:hypothetical protein
MDIHIHKCVTLSSRLVAANGIPQNQVPSYSNGRKNNCNQSPHIANLDVDTGLIKSIAKQIATQNRFPPVRKFFRINKPTGMRAVNRLLLNLRTDSRKREDYLIEGF